MTLSHFARPAVIVICIVAVAGSVAAARTQKDAPATLGQTGVLQGHVHDSTGKAVVGVRVFLQRAGDAATSQPQVSQTDSEGMFRFSSLSDGSYTLRAELKGDDLAAVVSMKLAQNERKTVDLVLVPAVGTHGSRSPASQSGASLSSKPEFFDEPQFTVAGVTQATSAGGHGSDTVLRNSDALVKATVSLGKEAEIAGPSENPSVVVHSDGSGAEQTGKLRKERDELRAQIRDGSAARDQQAGIHHQLAEVEEKLRDPLAAVREYQRASELAPSEAHLFDWGSELLTHRALEPATEVFVQGNRLYPQSVRILIGLGVAWYARGSYDQAARCLGSASDLNPADPAPYLFMGKMQSAETSPSPETVERLARFVRLEPGSALAQYYYAVGLWKARQTAGSLDEATSDEIAKLLQRAVELDPKLGAAYLQLGIVYAQRGDYVRAIVAYQKAIAVSPDLEETHYRLAQAYRHTGEEAKAKEELKLHEQLSKQSKQQAERERREIQQFVISLRDGSSQ